MSFFSAQPVNYVLTPRDWMHQAAVLFLVLSIVFVVIFRKKLRTWKYEKHRITSYNVCYTKLLRNQVPDQLHVLKNYIHLP